MAYIDKHFKLKQQLYIEYIEHIVDKYALHVNAEQDRAFRIVANHVSSHTAEQLRMYIGGMGGTGKSQVIKALQELFMIRKEGKKFIMLGPTGPSAVQINGFTYHSMLSLGWSNAKTGIEKARENIEGVEYIFIDELSMVSCLDLYRISECLSMCTGVYTKPFGGINIILAGDFAQLPPVDTNGHALYSRFVVHNLATCRTLHQQKEAIGKAVWHQVTTVVILRKKYVLTYPNTTRWHVKDSLREHAICSLYKRRHTVFKVKNCW